MINKITYILTAVSFVLAALFAILNRFWTGFVYFVLAIFLLLAIFWGVLLIVRYFTTFKDELNEEFKYFKAEKINKNHITSEIFEAGLPTYQKEFKKKSFKIKFVKWFVILFCFAVASAFLMAMILYKR